MDPKFEVVVLAHGQAKPVVDLYKSLYAWQGFPVHVLSPTDDPLPPENPSYRYKQVGKAAHSGPLAHQRVIETFQWMASLNTHLIVLEYDSFLLAEKVNVPEGVKANVCHNSHPEIWSPFYTGFPWIISQAAMQRVAAVVEKPETVEMGFADRILGACCHYAQIPLTTFGERGVTENTIGDVKRAYAYGRQGCIAIHGIKANDVLDAYLFGHIVYRASYVPIEA